MLSNIPPLARSTVAALIIMAAAAFSTAPSPTATGSTMERFAAGAVQGLVAQPAAASTVPMSYYWQAGAREDAKQWCEVHKGVTINGRWVQLYDCSVGTPSCRWAGFPYASTVGNCAVSFYMRDRTNTGKSRVCHGAAYYRYTANINAFRVYCYLDDRWA